jgi:hypothetical protein
MKTVVLLMGLGLTTLSACQAGGAPMNLNYVMRTPEGGIVQQFTVKGREADAATLTRLSAGLKDYTCQPADPFNNQTIEIVVQDATIRCSEARMDENEAVDQLIQAIRGLIGAQLGR